MTAQVHARALAAMVFLSCVALLAPSASRADEWFLKIDGVPGMLTEGRFAGWTRVQSIGALVCLPRNSTNESFGPAAFACEVRKAFDRTSPALLQSSGKGEPYPRVTLACVLTLPRPMLYRITLDNAFVASVRQEGMSVPDTVELERIDFCFEKIEVACLDLDASGGTTAGLTARFDQATGAGDLKTRPPFQVTVARQNGRPGVMLTWPAERGHRYEIRVGTANGGVWKTSNFLTASADGPLSQFLPTDSPNLLMRVDEVD